MQKTRKSTASSEVASFMVPELYRIVKAWRETHDSFSLEVAPADGSPVMKYLPGQFNMLYVFGVGEVPISISSNPDSMTLIHTVREAGVVTRQMAKLKAGEVIGVRGPFGTDWPMDVAKGMDILVMAGGIAFAPVRPIIYSVFNNRANFGKLAVLYGARTPADLLYEKEAKSWRQEDDTTVLITVDRAAPGWTGNVGVVTSLLGRAKYDNSYDTYNTVAMVCGPEIMMRFSVQELVKVGIPESRIYVSLERNMKCGVGLCGHCQMRSQFICKDGPVFRQDRIREMAHTREL